MPPNKNFTGWFKQISLLYIALLTGQTIFFLIAIALQYTQIFTAINGTDDILMYIAPAISALTIYYSFTIYRRRLQDITAKSDATEKLDEYRKLFLLRFALLEGGTIFAIITFVITGLPVAAVCAATGIAVFIFLRPNKDKIIADLQLSTSETELTENMDPPRMDQ